MEKSVSLIDPMVSSNFDVMKVLAIFMVAAEHYFKEYELLWVPSTVGLLIFSYSSGYFTAFKYHDNFSRKDFWKNKIRRLGINLLVVNAFLTVLFLFQGRSGIFSWLSLVNLIGMNGVLNWFGIPNLSPFGAGMWFFTLLLIFYVVYPFLSGMKKSSLTVLIVLSVCSAYFLNRNMQMGHSLWLTACGFLIGVWFQKLKIQIPLFIAVIFCVIIFISMVSANFVFRFNNLNFFFILFFSLSLIHACIQVNFPEWLRTPFLFCTGSILEIYLIHSYLFYTFTDIRFLDFILSMAVIIILAKIFSFVSSKLLWTLFKK